MGADIGIFVQPVLSVVDPVCSVDGLVVLVVASCDYDIIDLQDMLASL